MFFKDTWAEDEDGNRFVFTIEMKRRLHGAGLPIEPSSLKELKSFPTPVKASAPRSGGESRSSSAPREEKAASAPPRQPDIIQIDPETGKYIGSLKWYNPSRGYGFIARGGGEDIFFHKTSAIGDPAELQEGQWLLYDVEERTKGPEATEVEPYSGEIANNGS
jgi:CspA family cold shock protein